MSKLYFIRQKQGGVWRYYSSTGSNSHMWLQHFSFHHALTSIESVMQLKLMLSKDLSKGERENLEIAEVPVTYGEPCPIALDTEEQTKYEALALKRYNMLRDAKRKAEEKYNKPFNKFRRLLGAGT